ncbi:MAG: DNA-processing protein DprA [candidate division Zixibacteria bacterium]|nr:DNA-processing protein DprA [candidate division Zixibacteria bacterium]
MDSKRQQRLIETIGLLSIPGVGRGRFGKLIRVFGSVSEVRKASFTNLCSVNGISRSLAEVIAAQFDESKAAEIAKRVERLGWSVLFPDDDTYPHALSTIASAPPLLFRKGLPAKPDDHMIAIVGTRHPSENGRLFAFNFAKRLAADGIVIISGMAEGIDTAAHMGAIEAGGRTVAIWGSSLDHVYPTTNKQLAMDIATSGATYSEYFPGTRPDRAHFPERNRIISGFSEGVVVVEAGRKSGALITATLALEQNREVFAVPGSPGVGTSIGTNELIKKGASLITSVDDIYSELPTLRGEVVARQFKTLPDLTEPERRIMELVTSDPIQIDQISRTAQIPIEEITQYLLALELKGVIRELSGKRFVLAEEFAC